MKAKPIKRLKNLLTLGNLWLYILSLVKSRKMHAYAMDDEIEREFFFRPSKVMVYIVLHRLESEGLLTSVYDKRRKYYDITLKGKETLVLAKEYFGGLAGKL